MNRTQNVEHKGGRKRIRRGKKGKQRTDQITILYSNIQGVTGKKVSFMEIMEVCDPDICLLTETMTANFKLEGCKVVSPHKSVGQNVAVVLRKKFMNQPVVKIYEPNDTINMLGVRFVINNNNLRFYTAHLKQCSINSRDVIQDQFEEIRSQFRQATSSGEGMMLAFDANVHVGEKWIKGCTDKEDWGGKLLMEVVMEEKLILVNNLDICHGVVTRVDPRNGTCTTLDLVLCNSFMYDNLRSMHIDEDQLLLPTRYGKTKVTATDHNTIIINLSVERIGKVKRPSFYQTKSLEGREMFVQNVSADMELSDIFGDGLGGLDVEFDKFQAWWKNVLHCSFNKVSRNKKVQPGICSEVKELIRQERWIKENVMTNPERGRMIFQVRQQIKTKIQENTTLELEDSVKKLLTSSNPSSEVFKIRKKMKQKQVVGFPLRDIKGTLHVDKHGIDQVINEHFVKVFDQLKVDNNPIWHKYWQCIDDIYQLLGDINSGVSGIETRPRKEDIFKIISGMDKSKTVNGDMTIDLVKLGGEKLWETIFKCICWCYEAEDLPLQLRIEKMVLLYKNAGEIDQLDHYRGIFLRHIILSIMQKWLYTQNSGVLDMNGSEFAFGGRAERCAQEALLIVRLVQDHALWSGDTVYIKFMDVQKFFDTMNFRKALIDAYICGLKGKAWKMYDSLNKFKTCIPLTPLGEGTHLDLCEVFVQGSADAVLMAWNTMDMRNKKVKDGFDSSFVIEGIDLSGITFIDDIIEFTRTVEELVESLAADEVFQRSNRLRFKPSKCKIILINADAGTMGDMLTLNGESVEIVVRWKYLGTYVDQDGSRSYEFEVKIKSAQGVANEIVQICKSQELSYMRLRYVNLLLEACLSSKVKFGCEVWDSLNEGEEKDIDNLKVKVIKRVMELPYSTSSAAIKYEFGLTDLSLEVRMEKVLLAVKTLQSDNERKAKQLLQIMLSKKVPGFCTDVFDACDLFGVKLDELVGYVGDVRKMLKQKVIEIQEKRVQKQMMSQSKCDMLLLSSFEFNGKRQGYLDLPFHQARMIFMVRCRMLLTKTNFPGRWQGTFCNVCGCLDTDEHLFACPGFEDIIGGISYELFFNANQDLDDLAYGAEKMMLVNERLKVVQEL